MRMRATTTVTDNDGDISVANTSIGNLVGFQDDAPTLTAVTDLSVPNQINHSIIGNIGFSYGADGPGQITLIAPTIDGLTFQTDPITGQDHRLCRGDPGLFLGRGRPGYRSIYARYAVDPPGGLDADQLRHDCGIGQL